VAASYGLQAKVQSFGYALFFITDSALDEAEAKGWTVKERLEDHLPIREEVRTGALSGTPCLHRLKWKPLYKELNYIMLQAKTLKRSSTGCDMM